MHHNVTLASGVSCSEREIALALNRICAERPQLEPLIQAMEVRNDGTLAVGREFFGLFRSMPAAARARVVLRALLADPSLFRRPLTPAFTAAIATRLVAYLDSIPSRPLVTGMSTKDDISKPLARLLGVQQRNLSAVLNSVLPPLWAHATESTPCAPVGALTGLTDPATLDALMPLLHCRYLTAETALRLASEGMDAPTCAHYFHTPGADAIGVRNMAVYVGVVLDGDRDGGRAQNRLPLQIARRFGIRPRSIPETMALFDVIALTYDGALAVPASDPLGLRGLFDAPVPGGRSAFWDSALHSHRRRSIVSSESGADEPRGIFDTGLRFNAARATGLVRGNCARLERFGPYYATADARELHRICAPHWAGISPTLARRCKALLENSALIEPAIRLRDIGNILARSDLFPPEQHGLPSVAQYALGKDEPVATGLGSRHSRPRATKQPGGAAAFDMTQLQELQAMLDALGRQ